MPEQEKCPFHRKVEVTLSEHDARLAKLEKLSCPKTGKIRVSAESLIRFRNRHNISQKELSVLLEVCLVTVCRWEKGTMGIGMHSKLRFAAIRKKNKHEIRKLLSQ